MEHLLYSPAVAYVVYGAILFVSAMGIPVGSEVTTLTAGALASGELHPGPHLSLAVVIVLGVAAELAGSSAGYAIGRYGGRALVDRFGSRVLLSHKDLDRADAWFARHGDATVFLGRFIPLVRSFVSLAAGLGEMTYAKFLALSALACALWVTGVASLGYALGDSIHRALKAFKDAGYLAALLLVVVVVLAIAHRVRAVRAERARGLSE